MPHSADPPAAPLAPAGADQVTSLYQEIILQHYRAPRHKTGIADATATVEHRNPLCGDVLTMEVRVQDGRIAAAGFSARACSIAQATASMLLDRVVGQRVDDAAALLHGIDALIERAEPLSSDESDRLGDLRSLQSVVRFPARKACVRLVTATLADALGLPRPT